MEKEKEAPFGVVDAVHALNDVTDRLKLLYESTRMDLDSRRELDAFRDTSQMVLKNEINHLNSIMEDFSKSYEDVNYEPVKMTT